MSRQLSIHALILEGLKLQECEQNNWKKKAPIPFVPPKAELSRNEKEHTAKIKVTKHVEETIPVFCGGIPEHYLIHLRNCDNLMDKKELRTTWQGYMRKAVGATDDLQVLRMEEQNIHNQIKAKHLDEVMDVPEEVDMDTEPYDRAKKIKKNKWVQKGTSRSPKEIETLCSEIINAEKGQHSSLIEAFSLHEITMSDEMKTKWDAIVKAHCHTPNWEDKNGVSHAGVWGLSWKALDTCKRQWLLSIFTQDAAEIERRYLEHYIIRPDKMTIQAFLERLVQLNNYLLFLPRLTNNTDMPKTISPMNVSFVEQELARKLLHAMKDKYIHTFDTVQDKLFLLFAKDTVAKLDHIKI